VVGDPGTIRPGSTLVIPASYGGLADDNWDPESTAWVSDLGEMANWLHRGRAILRLHPDVLRTLNGEVTRDGIEAASGASINDLLKRPPPVSDEDSEEAVDDATAISTWLELLRAVSPLPEQWADLLNVIARPGRRKQGLDARCLAMPNRTWTLVARRRARPAARSGRALPVRGAFDATTEDESGSFVGREVTLQEHSNDVKSWAERFVRSLGLAEPVARDVALAAWLHDVGKADPRFQCLLLGGSEVRLANLRVPLAKSAATAHDVAATRVAQARAGYPTGYRHELLSVAMVQHHSDVLAQANDADLVLHLVGSHHGWCRPFPPLSEDPAPLHVTLEDHGGVKLEANSAHGLARLDSGVADRFWSLQQKYGWWGLAWLEALLRLADHRASEEEQQDIAT